jgi:hypothetical protein
VRARTSTRTPKGAKLNEGEGREESPGALCVWRLLVPLAPLGEDSLEKEIV